jgi:hypothetical protein
LPGTTNSSTVSLIPSTPNAGVTAPAANAHQRAVLDPDRFSGRGNGQTEGASNEGGAVMGGFMDKAKDMADQHDEQVDQGLDKAGDFADQKTGGKYDSQIDKGVDAAQERTGDGDTQQQ